MISISLFVADKIKMINDNLIRGLDGSDLESLEKVKDPLAALRNHVRESLQANLRESITDIIRKLKRDEPISVNDLQIIEKWLVGDAQYYTEIENNFQDWKKECKRLANILDSYSSAEQVEDEAKMFRLNALLTDLEFTLHDVIRYVYSLNRVKSFRERAGSGEISREDKRALAELMERQLYSSDF